MKKTIFLGWIALIAAPWLLVYIFLPAGKIELACQAEYEIARGVGAGKLVRSHGVMTSYYHADGSGMARYSGTLLTGDDRGHSNAYTVHRTSQFRYEMIGSFVKINSRSTAKHIDDNADDAMVNEYVYDGFKNNSVNYFQMLKMGNGSFAAGIGTMPRVYCGTLEKAS
jgi:hypothetical protein